MEDKTKWEKVYYAKLGTSGVSEESIKMLNELYGESIATASYSARNEYGLAYGGSLIDVVMTKLTPYAIRINELFPDAIRVSVSSIIKVCLIQHISKSVRLEKSNDMWRIDHLGELYTYTKGQPAIGTGLHSLQMAMACGISLTPEEVEAIVCIDKDTESDLQCKYHSGILTSIVRMANEAVYAEAKENHKTKTKIQEHE